MFIVVEGFDYNSIYDIANFLVEQIPNSTILREDRMWVSMWLDTMEQLPERSHEYFEYFCRARVEYGEEVEDCIKEGYIVINYDYYPATVCYYLENCHDLELRETFIGIYNEYFPQWKKPDLILIHSLPSDEESSREKNCYNQFHKIDDRVVYVKDKDEAWRIVKERLK
jgi:thymidylate kinase